MAAPRGPRLTPTQVAVLPALARALRLFLDRGPQAFREHVDHDPG